MKIIPRVDIERYLNEVSLFDGGSPYSSDSQNGYAGILGVQLGTRLGNRAVTYCGCVSLYR